MEYVVLFAIIIFCYKGSFFRNIQTSPKQKKRYLCFFSIYLILLYGLRCLQTGVDTMQYKAVFDSLFYFDSFTSYIKQRNEGASELGYMAWNWVIHWVGNYRLFMFCNAALMTLPVVYVFYKKSENVGLSVLLYILLGNFTINLSIARQGPAIALIFLAFYLFQQKSYRYSLLWYIIAVSFHTTSLIFLPFIFFHKYLENDKLVVAMIIVAKLVGSVVLPYTLPLLRINYADDIASQSVGEVTYYGFLALYFYMLYLKRKYHLNPDSSFGLFSVMLVLWPLVDTLAAAFRITFYFLIFLCLAAPEFIREMSKLPTKNVTKMFVIVLLIITGGYFYNTTFQNRARNAYPYYSVFEYPDEGAQPVLYKAR